MSDQMTVSAEEKAAETEADLVLRALIELGDELEGMAPREETCLSNPPPEWPPIAMPSEDGERLLAGLRAGLEKLACSVRRAPGEEWAVTAALDGAHLTIRNELITGHPEELRRLLPSLVYLVVLPITGEAQALRLAERATSGAEIRRVK